MSETTVPMEPTARLRAHAGSILAGSSVPAAEREDIAEELYGHLWQRWQDALAAGASASEAAETAIRSFGQASRLGREMTGAYHSRLYATTVGALLPAATASPGQPAGYRRLRVLLALIAVFQFVLVGTLINLTPVRAVLFALGLGFSIALSVLAFRAFGRAQRWALRYCQFMLAMALVTGAATLFSQPPDGVSIPILGILGLWMLGPAIGPQMAEWFSHSRPLGRGLAIAVAMSAAAGFALPQLATVMPDPTQVTASNLDLRVSAVCTRDTGGGVTDVEVTTSLRWSRLDILPYGLRQPETPVWLLDRFAPAVLTSGGAQASEWRESWVAGTAAERYGQPEPWYAGISSPDGSVEGALALRTVVVDPAAEAIEGAQFYPGRLHAGWTYQIEHRFTWFSHTGPAPADPLIAVWYIHLDKFVVQALATCEGPGSGVQVDTPTGVSQ